MVFTFDSAVSAVEEPVWFLLGGLNLLCGQNLGACKVEIDLVKRFIGVVEVEVNIVICKVLGATLKNIQVWLYFGGVWLETVGYATV